MFFFEECLTIDGQMTFWDFVITPLKDANSKIHQLIVTLTDITEYKRVEEQRKILISLIENSSDLIGIGDMTGKPIFINRAGLKLLGLDSLDNLENWHIRDALPPEVRVFHEKHILPQLMESGIWQGEIYFRHFQTQELIPVDFNEFVVKNEQTGENLGFATISRDIRQRQKVDAQLKEQEQFLRSIFEGFAQIVFVIDIAENGEARYSGWNLLAEKFSGLTQAQVIGKSLEDIHGVVQAAEMHQRNMKCIEMGISITCEELVTINGQDAWFLTTINPLKDETDRVYRLVATTVDITERKQVVEALKASQHFVQSIADSSPNILYIYDLEMQRNVYINRELTAVLGYSPTEIQQMEPMDIRKIVHPQDRRIFRERLQKFSTAKDGEIFEFEFRVLQVNGEWCWLYTRETVFSRVANGKVKEILCVGTNITERKIWEIKLQEQTKNLENALKNLKLAQVQLIQSEKMSSIGSMVAGIAHEINNPVNFIHGNLVPATEYIQDLLGLVELYEHYYSDPIPEIATKIQDIELEFLKKDLAKILQSMRVGTDRIREIVLSLRNFSRLDEAECKQVNIHDGINSTLMILQNRLRTKLYHPEISVIKEYGNIPLIDCYAGQLNQVFMNILSNAIDVLENISPEKTGEIRIQTEMLNRNQLVIRISDNGPGIPVENMTKLFDPFFTTKEVGKGTGLGLSISYQIVVEKHQGKLYCNSAPGRGTEFVIQIPITQPEALI